MQLIGRMFEKMFIQQLMDYYHFPLFIQQISKTGENKEEACFIYCSRIMLYQKELIYLKIKT